MSIEAFEEKYAQSWADTPPHVRKLWLEAWQAATSRQQERIRELEEALRLLRHEMIESGNGGSEDFGWSAAIKATNKALSATAQGVDSDDDNS